MRNDEKEVYDALMVEWWLGLSKEEQEAHVDDIVKHFAPPVWLGEWCAAKLAEAEDQKLRDQYWLDTLDGGYSA